jgi:hypothetical protein
MSDIDQSGEELDENLTSEYPPERPTAVFDEGVTGLEQLGGESVAERDARIEPEVWERSATDDPGGPVLEGDADVGVVDDEADLVGTAGELVDRGSLSDDDQVTGDETTRDYGTERVPLDAEDAAVHIVDEAPGATDH